MIAKRSDISYRMDTMDSEIRDFRNKTLGGDKILVGRTYLRIFF